MDIDGSNPRHLTQEASSDRSPAWSPDRGTVVQVGTLPDSIEIPGNIIMSKELNVVGSLQFGSEFGEVLNMMACKL